MANHNMACLFDYLIVVVYFQARVPIVSFVDLATGLTCDMCDAMLLTCDMCDVPCPLNAIVWLQFIFLLQDMQARQASPQILFVAAASTMCVHS